MPRPSASPELVRADGTRVRIGPSGCVLGRNPGCDLVLGDAAAPIHAVVWPHGPGVELQTTGWAGARSRLGDGDSFQVAGEQITVRCGPSPPAPPNVVLSIDGATYGLRRLPITLGSSTDDTLSHPRWPPNAARFESARDTIVLRFGTDGTVDDQPVVAGTRIPVASGRSVTLGALRFDLRRPAEARPAFPVRLRLGVRPHGATLDVWLAPDEPARSIALSSLRGRLLATLLGAGPGVEVQDEQLIAAIWSRGVVRTRLDVNQLVHRTRRDLSRAGLHGAAILVRHPAGGATVIRLAAAAFIEIG